MTNSTSQSGTADSAIGTVLSALDQVLQQRKAAAADDSYVASLYAGGAAKIGKKVGEEAAELIIAALQESDQHLINETADLWFHSMVMLAHRGLDSDAVLAELARRFGLSGHVEKAARTD